jgi:cysteine desulfurase
METSPPPAAGRYLDHNGSTPIAPEVRELCLRLSREEYGNGAAPHPMGRRAAALVEDARERLAAVLGAASAEEVVFTSGGTESDNWALFGVAARNPGAHLVTSAIEHKAVLEPARELERRGHPLTVLEPDGAGRVSPESVEAALRPDTALVSLMWANNETGVVQPVREVGELCRERGIAFHVDAVCAFGKVPVRVDEVPCDLLSLSAHKFHAPKGVGLQFVRRGTELAPLHFGCGHQGGLRSGTPQTVGVAAMALAAELSTSGSLRPTPALAETRERLFAGLRALLPGVERNGDGELLPNTLNAWFPGIPARALQGALAARGVSVAAGASAAAGQPSHVLTAMGLGAERAAQSLRLSLGVETTAEDIDAVLALLPAALEEARALAPAPAPAS